MGWKEAQPQGDPNDPTCWDYVRRGFCRRGDSCRYVHAFPGTEPGEQPVDVRHNNQDLLAQVAQQFASMMAGMEAPTSEEAAFSSAHQAACEPDLETQLREAVGLLTEGTQEQSTQGKSVGSREPQVVEPQPNFASQLMDAAAMLQSHVPEPSQPPRQGFYKPWAQAAKPQQQWGGSWHSSGWGWKGRPDWQERNVRPRLVDPPPVANETKPGHVPVTVEPPVMVPPSMDAKAEAPPRPPAPTRPAGDKQAQPVETKAAVSPAVSPDASNPKAASPADLKSKLEERKRRFEGW